MRYAFFAEHRERWPVRLQCRVLDVSASGYYDWVKREPGPRARRRAELGERIGDSPSRGTMAGSLFVSQAVRPSYWWARSTAGSAPPPALPRPAWPASPRRG